MVRAFDQFRKSSSFKLRKVFEITSRSQSSSSSSNQGVEPEGGGASPIDDRRSRNRTRSPMSMDGGQKRGSPLSNGAPGNDVQGSTKAVMSRLIREGVGKEKPKSSGPSLSISVASVTAQTNNLALSVFIQGRAEWQAKPILVLGSICLMRIFFCYLA